MAESKSGISGLAFIVGALVVVVGGLIWYIYSGGDVPAGDAPEIQIDLPDNNG